MDQWPIGVFVSCDAGLGLPLELVKEIGVPTVQLHAPHAESRTPAKAAEIRQRLAELDIIPTCMFAGFEGESYADIPTVKQTVGLAPPESRAARLVELAEVADMAHEMEIDAVGLHIGFVPHDPNDPEYHHLLTAVGAICDRCAERDQAVHLETGQEPVEVLMRFIHDSGRHNLYVNFDPANMILYGAGEPIPALVTLAPYVRSVHCKDATWSDKPGETWGSEVPLGQGAVDMEAYLRTLLNIGYEGPLTIEREIPRERERQKAEILSAVTLLQEIKDRLLGEE